VEQGLLGRSFNSFIDENKGTLVSKNGQSGQQRSDTPESSASRQGRAPSKDQGPEGKGR
jgi:hypothetical protein